MSVLTKVSDHKVRAGAMSEHEAQIRRDLAAAYRLIALKEWDDLLATHLSARVTEPDGEDSFLINPFGMMFEEITASCLLKVSMNGEILQDTPYTLNRAGFVIHSAVHAARPDAGAVMHLHTPDGIAVSSVEDGLLPLNQHSMLIAEHIAFHDYEGVAENEDERERLGADLGMKPLMLLRNHGTLAVGRSIASTFSDLYLLETCCTIQVRTLGMGLKPNVVAQQVIAEMAKMIPNRGASSFADTTVWPALLRKLDRVNPGYDDL